MAENVEFSLRSRNKFHSPWLYVTVSACLITSSIQWPLKPAAKKMEIEDNCDTAPPLGFGGEINVHALPGAIAHGCSFSCLLWSRLLNCMWAVHLRQSYPKDRFWTLHGFSFVYLFLLFHCKKPLFKKSPIMCRDSNFFQEVGVGDWEEKNGFWKTDSECESLSL